MREDVAGLEVPQDLQARFGKYVDDPTGFVRHTHALVYGRAEVLRRAILCSGYFRVRAG